MTLAFKNTPKLIQGISYDETLVQVLSVEFFTFTVRKNIDACYAYELYSNLCQPSRLLNASTESEEPLYDRATLLFEERVDLDFGLQDKLLANGVLSWAQYADIKTSQSSLCGARKLWGYTQEKSADFTLALRRTKQQHLLNYVWSSGSKCIINDLKVKVCNA